MWQFTLVLLIALHKHIAGVSIVGNPLVFFHLCNGTDDISSALEPGLPPEEENKYSLFIHKQIPKSSNVDIIFDTEAVVTLNNPDYARIYAKPDNEFRIRFFKEKESFGMDVKGVKAGVIPYPTSININNDEFCSNPSIGIMDSYLQGVKDTAESIKKPTQSSCGRRKVVHTELITNSQPSKAGDWPWHAAIYRFEKGTLTYKCGGTLIAKNIIVTAAHCVTIRGVPLSAEVVNVVLGKYNLIGGDLETQEREVFQITVFPKYNASNLDHDIAILKLRTEAVFNDYIQPACIWNPSVVERIAKGTIHGTVVGWGFDHTDQLSSQLRQATLPKISESKCLKSDPVFFGRMLNDYKFCAGYRNGTSACNGDSGGGFSVFVPDESDSGTNSDVPGSWYLRGIVSVGIARKNIALCDPNHYVLFTDTAKYRGWIERNL